MKKICFVIIVSFSFCINKGNTDFKTEFETPKNEHTHADSIEFQRFWNSFRKAILNADSASIIKMTSFPLTLIGNEDTDPKLKIKNDKFMSVLNIYLNKKTSYFNNDWETNLNFIKRDSISKEYSNSDKFQRIGDMEFEKVNKQWKLTALYLDTKKLKL